MNLALNPGLLAEIEAAAPGALGAQGTEPSAALDYYGLFARSVVMTLSVELIVLFLVVRLWFKLTRRSLSNPLLVFAGIFASSGTLPWLWFVLPRVIPSYGLMIAVGEVLVWAAEALFYHCVLRLSWKRSGLLSLVCNSASYCTGLLVL